MAMLLLSQINIFPNCLWAAVSRRCTFRTTVILLFQDNLLFEVVCWWIFCNFCASVFSYFGVKKRHFSTNFEINFDAQNAGNSICGLQISKIFRGVCPQTQANFIQNITVRLKHWIRPWVHDDDGDDNEVSSTSDNEQSYSDGKKVEKQTKKKVPSFTPL